MDFRRFKQCANIADFGRVPLNQPDSAEQGLTPHFVFVAERRQRQTKCSALPGVGDVVSAGLIVSSRDDCGRTATNHRMRIVGSMSARQMCLNE
jgi:hypothetical protein